MNANTVLLLAFLMMLSFVHQPAGAQGLPWQQNQIAAANANQAQMAGAAQLQSGQLARVMITAYDKDGDEALNAVELQAGLVELLLRMSASLGRQQMQQAGGREAQQQYLGFQGRQGITAGPSRRPGRGRGR